jgi:hypothetical protein
MRDDVRLAWVIAAGERNGAEFDFDSMSWLERK